MKKLLLILLCVPLIFSCGEKEKENNTENNDINELKGNNNKYDFYPDPDMQDIGGYVFNKETGELWFAYKYHHNETNITRVISKEDLK